MKGSDAPMNVYFWVLVALISFGVIMYLSSRYANIIEGLL